MKMCLITFRSVTPAQRAEAALTGSGITCKLVRTPRWMQEQGCGYSVHLTAGEVPSAVALLERRKIAYRKIYCAGEKGRWEEMEG